MPENCCQIYWDVSGHLQRQTEEDNGKVVSGSPPEWKEILHLLRIKEIIMSWIWMCNWRKILSVKGKDPEVMKKTSRLILRKYIKWRNKAANFLYQDKENIEL